MEIEIFMFPCKFSANVKVQQWKEYNKKNVY